MCWGRVGSREEFLSLFDTCFSFICKIDEKETDERLDPKKLYLEISGMTPKSGMTPMTGMPLIIKTDISISIDNTNDKHSNSLGVISSNNVPADSLTIQNSSLDVIGVIPDTAQEGKSDRDVQYYKAKECDLIQKTGTKEEVQNRYHHYLNL